jgi:uncharacterized protein (UPF0276 family)
MFKIKRPISTNSVGIGLRHPHHDYVSKNKPNVPWFEVHSENFFAQGGPALHFLQEIRESYPLSLHGVGLSLGSAQKVDLTHLKKLKNLIKFSEPFLVSDHISWSNIQNQVLNDLLPLPYTKESLEALCNNISQSQDYLKREILVENPSTYLSFVESDKKEDDFINTLAKKTGCKILLDINNIYVSSHNNNFDPISYINNINQNIVGEMHLAGHSKSIINNKTVLIDTHDNYVCDEVWELYKIASKKFNVPTLIEWDQDLPSFEDLLGEAKKAEKIIENNESS